MWKLVLSAGLSLIAPQRSLATNCTGLFEYPLLATEPGALSASPTYIQLSSTQNGSLLISDRALIKSRALIHSPDEARGKSTMFGFGLTRLTGADLFIEDFVSPDPSRVFWIDETTQKATRFIDALLESSMLVLALQRGQLVLRSSGSDLPFSQSEWKTFRPYVELACRQTLPQDYRRAAGFVRKRNFLTLQTGWQMVISADAALLSNAYLEQLKKQARKQGYGLQFVMHRHRFSPSLTAKMGQMSEDERKEQFSRLLSPTAADLVAMDKTEVDWFELRTAGTPLRFDSTLEATSRFFRMQEIHHLKKEFEALYEELTKISPERVPEVERKLTEIEGQAEAVHLPLETLLSYALGPERFEQLLRQLNQTDLLGSAHDLLIYRLLMRWIR